MSPVWCYSDFFKTNLDEANIFGSLLPLRFWLASLTHLYRSVLSMYTLYALSCNISDLKPRMLDQSQVIRFFERASLLDFTITFCKKRRVSLICALYVRTVTQCYQYDILAIDYTIIMVDLSRISVCLKAVVVLLEVQLWKV